MLPNLIGQTLGNYQVLARLGQGKDSAVYKARQSNLSRIVTLKVTSAQNREGADRLGRESILLAKLGQNAGIRSAWSIETDGAYVFTALEHAEGSLRGQKSSRFEHGRAFSRTEVVCYLLPVASVLDYLHGQGRVHLDGKPENVMIIDRQRLALADFGIAQPFGKAQNPGTPGYASPEMLGGEAVGPPADIFALAAVAYEMLVGQPPFRGTPIDRISATQLAVPARVDQVSSHCSNSLRFVLKGALAGNSRERDPRSAGALLDLLDRAARITLRLPTLPRRRPILVREVGALLCLASGVGFWRTWSSPAARPASPSVAGLTLVEAQATILETPRVAMPSSALPNRIAVMPAPSASRTAPTLTLAPTMTPRPTAGPASTQTLPGQSRIRMACTNAKQGVGAAIVEPGANAKPKRGPIRVRSTADLPSMTEYELYVHDSSLPPDSSAWRDSQAATVRDGLPWTWHAGTLAPGPYTLRLRVKLNNGQHKECDVPVTLESRIRG